MTGWAERLERGVLGGVARYWQSPCSPCWSRRIVAQYLCGHHARRIRRTWYAVSGEQLVALAICNQTI